MHSQSLVGIAPNSLSSHPAAHSLIPNLSGQKDLGDVVFVWLQLQLEQQLQQHLTGGTKLQSETSGIAQAASAAPATLSHEAAECKPSPAVVGAAIWTFV